MENLAGYAMEVSVGEVSMLRGEAGKSAYEIAVQNGYSGTETEWLASLKGETGASVTIDDTLTQSGRAADAKATGDRLDALSEKIAAIPSGKDGKSAYAYALEGGYTGTEEAFSTKLAQEQLSGTTSELTPTQVYSAVSAGIPVKVQYLDGTCGLLSFTAFSISESAKMIASCIIVLLSGGYLLAELYGDNSTNVWGFNATFLAQKTDIPTDDHINSLIDTKLGVIENGSY